MSSHTHFARESGPNIENLCQQSLHSLLFKVKKNYPWHFCFPQSISEIEPKYYADGEDAYAMRRDLTGLRLEVSSTATLENLKIILMNVGFGMSGSEEKFKSLFGG